ncbi:MAG: protein kinase [Myxococcales bacterium]|nr:protein kinase [Myxococcales bacterium]
MNHDPFVGKVIDGRYEIQARVGEGGMGVVYRARQVSIDRVIALKMLNPQMATDPTWVQRFYNEAKACSRLQHPNTIRMFDFGQTAEGRLFMTMEFLDGIGLRQAIQQGPFPAQRVIKILIQCCASLAEAHAIGIIHRDIKPDNVFLLNMPGSPDFVKLLDFSVAKLLQEGDKNSTQAGVVFGTPQYMSPEQGRGLPLDARSDLYALGILAYEMLTGRVPYNDENPMTVIQMHLRSEIPPMPAHIPYPVQQVVRKALEKDPARRFQSAGEMMQHCQQVFSELNHGGPVPGGGGQMRTAIAPGIGANPGMQQGMPNMQVGPPIAAGAGAQASGGYVAAAPQQKTMMAMPAANPFPQGGAQAGYPQPGAQAGYPQAGGQPGYPQAGGFGGSAGGQSPNGAPRPAAGGAGFVASPLQKTMVAGLPPPQLTNPQGQPQQGQGPAAGPNKTVVINPSEGVVSMAQQGGMPGMQGMQGMPGMQGMQGMQGMGARPVEAMPPPSQGASAAYWTVCLLGGIAAGVGAYLIVRFI